MGEEEEDEEKEAAGAGGVGWSSKNAATAQVFREPDSSLTSPPGL